MAYFLNQIDKKHEGFWKVFNKRFSSVNNKNVSKYLGEKEG